MISDIQFNDLTQELGVNFIEYAVAVNTDRAIPDAKSGLKPVARRIIYDAYVTGCTNNKPHVKCAAIVGDTMGRFHPHGKWLPWLNRGIKREGWDANPNRRLWEP